MLPLGQTIAGLMLMPFVLMKNSFQKRIFSFATDLQTYLAKQKRAQCRAPYLWYKTYKDLQSSTFFKESILIMMVGQFHSCFFRWEYALLVLWLSESTSSKGILLQGQHLIQIKLAIRRCKIRVENLLVAPTRNAIVIVFNELEQKERLSSSCACVD